MGEGGIVEVEPGPGLSGVGGRVCWICELSADLRAWRCAVKALFAAALKAGVVVVGGGGSVAIEGGLICERDVGGGGRRDGMPTGGGITDGRLGVRLPVNGGGTIIPAFDWL